MNGISKIVPPKGIISKTESNRLPTTMKKQYAYPSNDELREGYIHDLKLYFLNFCHLSHLNA
jgi:hypothetical protein